MTATTERKIYITAPDFDRLRSLVDAGALSAWARDGRLQELEAELDRSEVLAPEDIPSDVVTMHSEVRLVDLDTQQTMTYTLVYPHEADIDQGKISVLAPIGTAILGFRRGDVFEWRVPGGLRRMRILEVASRSESARIVPA
jgi:regulator of nucleoside diphosphate kinase